MAKNISKSKDILTVIMKIKYIHIGMAGSIFVLSVVTVYLYDKTQNPENILFGISNLISVMSLFIFILYNSEQLVENEKNRMLQNQPLPVIDNYESYIEVPACYWYMPLVRPDDWKSSDRFMPDFIYRLFFKHKVKNIGNSTAVSIDVCPSIEININENITSYKPVAEHIPYLKQDESTIEQLDHTFVYLKNSVLKAFLSGNSKSLPIIEMCILYKNALGATFKIDQKYQLWMREEKIDIIKEWLKIINNANINYNEEIRMITITEDEKEKEKIFDKIRDDFNSKFSEENLDMFVEVLPGTFKINNISEKEYGKMVNKIRYPRRVGVPKIEEDESIK